MVGIGRAGQSAAAEARRRARRRLVGRVGAVVLLAAAAAVMGWGVGPLPGQPAAARAATDPRPALAAAGCIALIAWWLGRDRGAGRWSAGAAGEEATAALLDGLGVRFTVIHDLRVPGTRANIDHLVVGPNGVTVVDSKQWAGTVRIGRRHLRHGGQRRDEVIEQQRWCADVVGRALADAGHHDLPVHAAVVVHGAAIRRGPFRRRRVDGVAVAGPADARRVVSRGPRVVGRRRAAEVADVLCDALAR